jgi:hypothetical protein
MSDPWERYAHSKRSISNKRKGNSNSNNNNNNNNTNDDIKHQPNMGSVSTTMTQYTLGTASKKAKLEQTQNEELENQSGTRPRTLRDFLQQYQHHEPNNPSTSFPKDDNTAAEYQKLGEDWKQKIPEYDKDDVVTEIRPENRRNEKMTRTSKERSSSKSNIKDDTALAFFKEFRKRQEKLEKVEKLSTSSTSSTNKYREASKHHTTAGVTNAVTTMLDRLNPNEATTLFKSLDDKYLQLEYHKILHAEYLKDVGDKFQLLQKRLELDKQMEDIERKIQDGYQPYHQTDVLIEEFFLDSKNVIAPPSNFPVVLSSLTTSQQIRHNQFVMNPDCLTRFADSVCSDSKNSMSPVRVPFLYPSLQKRLEAKLKEQRTMTKPIISLSSILEDESTNKEEKKSISVTLSSLNMTSAPKELESLTTITSSTTSTSTMNSQYKLSIIMENCIGQMLYLDELSRLASTCGSYQFIARKKLDKACRRILPLIPRTCTSNRKHIFNDVLVGSVATGASAFEHVLNSMSLAITREVKHDPIDTNTDTINGNHGDDDADDDDDDDDDSDIKKDKMKLITSQSNTHVIDCKGKTSKLQDIGRQRALWEARKNAMKLVYNMIHPDGSRLTLHQSSSSSSSSSSSLTKKQSQVKVDDNNNDNNDNNVESIDEDVVILPKASKLNTVLNVPFCRGVPSVPKFSTCSYSEHHTLSKIILDKTFLGHFHQQSSQSPQSRDTPIESYFTPSMELRKRCHHSSLHPLGLGLASQAILPSQCSVSLNNRENSNKSSFDMLNVKQTPHTYCDSSYYQSNVYLISNKLVHRPCIKCSTPRLQFIRILEFVRYEIFKLFHNIWIQNKTILDRKLREQSNLISSIRLYCPVFDQWLKLTGLGHNIFAILAHQS